MQSIYCALITRVKQAYHIVGKLFRLYKSQVLLSLIEMSCGRIFSTLSLQATTFLAYTANQEMFCFNETFLQNHSKM